jgi:hypothetical protein
MSRVEQAAVHGVEHLERRHHRAGGLEFHLEPSAGHLGDLVDESLGIDLVEVIGRPAALHLPLRSRGRRLGISGSHRRADEQEQHTEAGEGSHAAHDAPPSGGVNDALVPGAGPGAIRYTMG